MRLFIEISGGQYLTMKEALNLMVGRRDRVASQSVEKARDLQTLIIVVE